jgi:hypothetical protein
MKIPEPEIKVTTIYIRFNIEEGAVSVLCGQPTHNWIAMEMLASCLKAELRRAKIPMFSLHHHGALNDGNITILVHAPTSLRRRLFRLLEKLRLFEYRMGNGPWTALRAVGEVLKKFRLLNAATIHWYDDTADVDRRFNRAAGDADAPFDLNAFVHQLHAHHKLDQHREAKIKELLVILEKQIPLPPLTPP